MPMRSSIPWYKEALFRKRTPKGLRVANDEGSDSHVNTSCSISSANITTSSFSGAFSQHQIGNNNTFDVHHQQQASSNHFNQEEPSYHFSQLNTVDASQITQDPTQDFFQSPPQLEPHAHPQPQTQLQNAAGTSCDVEPDVTSSGFIATASVEASSAQSAPGMSSSPPDSITAPKSVPESLEADTIRTADRADNAQKMERGSRIDTFAVPKACKQALKTLLRQKKPASIRYVDWILRYFSRYDFKCKSFEMYVQIFLMFHYGFAKKSSNTRGKYQVTKFKQSSFEDLKNVLDKAISEQSNWGYYKRASGMEYKMLIHFFCVASKLTKVCSCREICEPAKLLVSYSSTKNTSTLKKVVLESFFETTIKRKWRCKNEFYVFKDIVQCDEDTLANKSVSGILNRTNYSNSESTVEYATPKKRKITNNAPQSPEYPIRNVDTLLTQSDDWLLPVTPQSEGGEPIVNGETTNQDQADPPSEDSDRQTETAASSDPADNAEGTAANADDDDGVGSVQDEEVDESGEGNEYDDDHVSGPLSTQADRKPCHSFGLSAYHITRFLGESCTNSDTRRSMIRKINRQLKSYFATRTNSHCETSINVDCNRLLKCLKMGLFTADAHNAREIVFNAMLQHFVCDITRCPPDAILTSDIREYLCIFAGLMIRPTFDLSPLFNFANDVIKRYHRKNKFYATLIFGTNSQELETLMQDAIFLNINLSEFLEHPGEKNFLIPLIVYFCGEAQDEFLSITKE